MRIAVVGVGGVGGYFGGRLAQADLANTYLIARGATLNALRTSGLRVDSINGNIVLPHVNATDDPKSVGEVDAVLLAVKTFGIAEALQSIRPMIGEHTIVVPLENGIEAPDQITAALGADHAAGGLTALISFIVEPGHIRHVATEPIIMLGELDNRPSDRARRLCDALVAAGIHAEIPEDIRRSMWTKFLFITPLSAIGAVTRVPVGVWRSMPELRAMASTALREIIAIATARGIDLGDDAEAKTIARYDALAADATSSLQRDIMQGKPSELDAQLGAVVRLGKSANLATPVHETLYRSLLPQERVARGIG